MWSKLPFLTLFFPSWRFFSKAFCPQLRSEGREITFSSPRRKWWNLFFNSEGNRALAQWDLVDRFLVEAQSCSPGEVENLTTYKMLVRLVEPSKQCPETEKISFQIYDHEHLYFETTSSGVHL